MTTAELFWIKTAMALGVMAVGLAGALLPWTLGTRGTSERSLALSDTFAGGVLGGAGLIHLLSSGMSSFHAALPGVTYPLALLLAGTGFLALLLIEGVVVPGRLGTVEPHAWAGPTAAQHEVSWSGRHPPKATILLAVLSVHSVLLGLALGAQRAATGAVIVFLAIVAHKSAAGFALGVSYQRAGLTRRRSLPPALFFSTMTPLGIMIGAGAGVALTSHGSQLFEAVFDSLGAGTFLYIAALDIIKTEFDTPSHRWQKWFAAVLGFGAMAVLAVWI